MDHYELLLSIYAVSIFPDGQHTTQPHARHAVGDSQHTMPKTPRNPRATNMPLKRTCQHFITCIFDCLFVARCCIRPIITHTNIHILIHT